MVTCSWLVVVALDFLVLVQAALAAIGLATPAVEASFYFVCGSAVSLLVIWVFIVLTAVLRFVVLTCVLRVVNDGLCLGGCYFGASVFRVWRFWVCIMLESSPSNSASALIAKTPKPFLGCNLLWYPTELRLEDLAALTQLDQLLVKIFVEIVKLTFLQLVVNPAQHGGQFIAC